MIIDEAARVPDELYKTLRPMLTVANGDLWLLSTPWGKQGFFHENWEYGGDAWARFRVPATECSRIAAERLEMERGQMGDPWFRQEYMCEFLATESQMFDTDLVSASLDREEPWSLRRGSTETRVTSNVVFIGLDLGRSGIIARSQWWSARRSGLHGCRRRRSVCGFAICNEFRWGHRT